VKETSVFEHIEPKSYFSTLLHLHAFNWNPIKINLSYHSLLPYLVVVYGYIQLRHAVMSLMLSL
jgi:hypothetical protein